MTSESQRSELAAFMRRINDAWLAGRAGDLAAVVHPDVVMTSPGFAGRSEGRDVFLAGFREFCDTARIHEFRERDIHIDVVDRTGVVTFLFEMLYERAGKRYRATGRDFWIFERHEGTWLAVWRTMLDVQENPETE